MTSQPGGLFTETAGSQMNSKLGVFQLKGEGKKQKKKKNTAGTQKKQRQF